MINNYKYFIVLAEQCNISRAAEKLYISHQCLSRYLKTLEQTYQVSFFNRGSTMTLTDAGKVYYETALQLQMLEENLDNQLDTLRNSRHGSIRFAATDGRSRILMPDVLSQFKTVYPNVEIEVCVESNSNELSRQLLAGKLDLALLNHNGVDQGQLQIVPLIEENLYLVLTDKMLRQYFPDDYPGCIERFSKGADLIEFQHIPFISGEKNHNLWTMLGAFLEKNRISLNFVMELPQLDMHYQMTLRNYAASFCWSMYIPAVKRINDTNTGEQMHIFPIKDWNTSNHLVLAYKKGKIMAPYCKEFISLIKKYCQSKT